MSAPFVLPSGRLSGTLHVPGSKSITNRALVAAALAKGTSTLEGPLESTDTRVLALALEALGARVTLGETTWKVEGPLTGAPGGSLALDVGEAGTPARFLTALLCVLPGEYRLDGSARMRERPMAPLVAALRGLGADIRWAGEEGFLPLVIRGGTIKGGRAAIRGDVSSQFFSALMLVSPLVPGGIELAIEGPASSGSYVMLTRRVIEGFSGRAGEGYRPCSFRIEGDDSAACFPIAGALVSGGRVSLAGLSRDSHQPDAVFREWAALAGGTLSWEGRDGSERLVVNGSRLASPRALSALTVDVDATPDAALPLAALLAFASGTSRLSGVARLRAKESDRLAAAHDLLSRCGAVSREERLPDGGPRLEIDGASGVPRRADFSAHGDHRVAMSAAVLALALPPGSTLDRPETVAKSWPSFFSEWDRLIEKGP